MRWIVFDFGEVISLRTRALPTMAAMLGVSRDAFEDAYWPLREPYDRGCSDLDYWRRLGARIGVSVAPGLAEELTRVDLEGWLSTDAEAVRLAEELTAAGHDLCLLSNAPASHGNAFRRQPWASLFRHILISAELGSAKPDAQIWTALLERLETPPEDWVFFDDKQSNVDGARTAGIPAFRWAGAEAARADLRTLGIHAERAG
jgi:putative hydrolase of the HAD superfamily